MKGPTERAKVPRAYESYNAADRTHKAQRQIRRNISYLRK